MNTASRVGWKWPQVARVLEARATLTAAWMLAGWPIVRWYVARLHDGSDEPLGLLAWVAALAFAPRRGWREPLGSVRVGALVCVMLGYIAGYASLPPLGRAVLWVAGLGLLAAPRTYALAWTALLVLSLPLVATLQFYLGYPLRCLTTQAAAGLLYLGGLRVGASGTVLHWAGERVLIDAPCSGIQMLWTLTLVSATVAAARGLNTAATLRLFRFAGFVVFWANTLRAVLLFCIELRLVWTPPYAHESVGLALFAASGLALWWRSERVEFSSRKLMSSLLRGKRRAGSAQELGVSLASQRAVVGKDGGLVQGALAPEAPRP